MAADVTAHFTCNFVPAILHRSKLKSIYSKWKMSDQRKLKGWRWQLLASFGNAVIHPQIS